MRDITRKVLDKAYASYEKSSDKIHLSFISRLQERNATCYELSHIAQNPEKFEELRKSQYWPIYANADYYGKLLDQLSFEQLDLIAVIPPTKEELDTPVTLFQLEDITIKTHYLLDGISTFHCVDQFQNSFFSYSVLESVIDTLKTNKQKKFEMLLQPTIRDLTLNNRLEGPLLSILYALPIDEDDDTVVEKIIDEPVLV